jgi:hypothetical protein
MSDHCDPNDPEILALRLAMADAISAWAHLEDALCALLGTILQSNLTNFGPAVYFGPSAAETRIAIVERAVSEFSSNLRIGSQMFAVWRTIEAKLNRARKVRNKLAHGSVVLIKWRNGKRRPSITGPFFGLDFEANQPPGLSLHDVKAANHTFDFCSGVIRQFTEIVRSARRAPHDEHQALLDKCHELAACIQNEAARSGAQNHPAPEIPPQSSPE